MTFLKKGHEIIQLWIFPLPIHRRHPIFPPLYFDLLLITLDLIFLSILILAFLLLIVLPTIPPPLLFSSHLPLRPSFFSLRLFLETIDNGIDLLEDLFLVDAVGDLGEDWVIFLPDEVDLLAGKTGFDWLVGEVLVVAAVVCGEALFLVVEFLCQGFECVNRGVLFMSLIL